MTETPPGELWTADAHRAYRGAVDLVRHALDDHSRAVDRLAAADLGPAPAQDDLLLTAAALESALADLSEIEVALTGSAAFWLDDADASTDDDAADIEVDDGPVGDEDSGRVPVVVNLQLAMDILDVDQVIGMARILDPDASVTTLQDALFVLGGGMGWDAVIGDHLEHIEMRSLATEVHTQP